MRNVREIEEEEEDGHGHASEEEGDSHGHASDNEVSMNIGDFSQLTTSVKIQFIVAY